MSDQMTFEDLHSATGSPELADGRTLYDSPGGLTTANAGPEVARVNPSQLPMLPMGGRKGKQTKGTYCLTFYGSSASIILQASLESKSRMQFSLDGSMNCSMGLKYLITPAGRVLMKRTVLQPITSAVGSIGWPTPCARDGKDISRSNAFLSQRKRHAPSMATRLLERGAPWEVITEIYCLAMGYPSSWNDARPEVTETR